MANGVIKGVAAGMLMGAGALWAYGSMNRQQKMRMAKLATMAADKVTRKANEMMK